MIKYVSGDILRANTEYIAHGVATGSQQGADTVLAAQISKRFPEVQKHFRQFTRGNKFQGGDLFIVAPARNRPGFIYIATKPETNDLSTSFLNRGLRKLERYCVKNKIKSVSLPRLESGPDRLNWELDVQPLIEKYLDDQSTVFYVYDI